MDSQERSGAAFRAIVVALSSLLTACAAHAGAGGGNPSLLQLLAVSVLLYPLARVVYRWGHHGTVTFGVCVFSQGVVHSGLGLVGAQGGHCGEGAHSISHAAGMHAALGASLPEDAHSAGPSIIATHSGPGDLGHATHDPAAAAVALREAIDTSSGWTGFLSHLAHAAHMGPTMWAAHLSAAVITVVLVSAILAGARRMAARIVAAVLAVIRGLVPQPENTAGWRQPVVLQPSHHVYARLVRGPPLYS